jgi:hypothetical protein
MKRKILVSPGFGAGWSTWHDGEVAKYMLTYEPLIKAIEEEGEIAVAVEQLEADVQRLFGEDIYTGGIDSLCVVEVEGRVLIEEYDGSEAWTSEEGLNARLM